MVIFKYCLITIALCVVLFPSNTYAQKCFDADFESGTVGGYVAYHGRISGNGTVTFQNQQISEEQHKIMQVSDGYDPIAEQLCEENKNLLVAGSGTGSHTLRLGDVFGGARASKVELSLDVTDEVSFFLLKYAIVINDPSHNHAVQPRFELNIKDQDGNQLSCGHYEVRAAENIEGFESCGDWRVRPWTTAGFELASYLGQTIIIEIISTDCGKGGHGGYAYIDATCSPLELDLESYCPGAGFARYVVTEGFDEYEWNTGEKTRFLEINDPVPGTEYQVTVTSSTGCTLVLKDTLPTLPSISSAIPSYFDGPKDTLSVCLGEEVSYRPTGTNIEDVYAIELGYSSTEFYLLAEESRVINFVTSDNLGCVYDTTQLFLDVQHLDVEFELGHSCDGDDNGEILITNYGNSYMETSIGNLDFQNVFHYPNLPPGQYTINFRFGNSCTESKSVYINSQESPQLTQIYTNPSTCDEENGNIYLEYNNDDSLLFSINGSDYSTQSFYNDLPGGIYQIKYKNSEDGCVKEELVNIESYSAPDLELAVSDSTYCGLENGLLELHAQGGYPPLSFSINNSEFGENYSFTGLASRDYQIIVKDDVNCRDTIQHSIYSAPYIQIDSISTTAVLCDEENGALEISLNDLSIPYQLYLDAIEIDDLIVEELASGSHELLVVDHNGCEDSFFPFIDEIPEPTIDSISYFMQACGRDLVNLRVVGSSFNDSLEYSLGGNYYGDNNSYSLVPDEYLFSIQDANGCIADTLVHIPSEEWLGMANIFTPNRDGNYDLFCCPQADNIIAVDEFTIYDRWGSKVFDEHGIIGHDICWDGTFGNQEVENGVYVYYIKVELADGRVLCKYGDVTVAK